MAHACTYGMILHQVNYKSFYHKLNIIHVVPGPVVDLSSSLLEMTIELTWNPPSEPNGVITNYQVTYRVNNSRLVTINTTDSNTTSFTITSLTPGTRVSNISVSAYTSAGRGVVAYLEDVTQFENFCEEHSM